MEFKFQSNLDFQREAIDSVIDIFKSQKFIDDDYVMVPENGTISNTLSINDAQIMQNLVDIQKSNKISISQKLDGRNFSVEMETGTGKTYVYLRTLFDLFKQYGFKKFIIVVPSVAIREGVLKTLNITKNHFMELYDNISYRYYEYDSKKLNLIQQFARSHTIEIMVITIDSFKKDHTIMQQERDSLNGQKPIELVHNTKPIVILDEPQNMETDIAKKAIASMNPLFTLRYSATHKHHYNLVYRLDPVDAYNKQLVKKIEVSSVTKNDYNSVFLRCREIKANSKGIKAKIELDKKTSNAFKRKTITVKDGDDLSAKTENPKYDGFILSEINAKHNFIEFRNGVKIKQGEGQGDDLKTIMKIQIDQTIEEHFRKYESLKEKGIKPLSLFFIDRVDNYLSEDGFIKNAFEHSFNKHKKGYEDFKNISAKDVRSGYFSAKNKYNSIEKDKKAFDLIMKDKERLLSFEEPVSFVFSHSALREGWDNPNVFNICTLNQTISDMKKRQELGRGMRLPVDKDGNRITNEEHILTVIANESYEEYASKLQQEYEEEYGVGFTGIKPSNARERETLTLKKGYHLNPEFKELWQQISKKTRYAVQINTDELIDDCIVEINKMTVNKIKIKINKIRLSLEKGDGVVTNFVGEGSEEYPKCFPIPNVVEQITYETNLTRTTIVNILNKVKNLDLIFNDPQEFITSCITVIRGKLADMLVNGIKYLQVEDWYRMELFDDIKTYKNMIIQANKTIYDGTVVDSKIEQKFAEGLDRMDNVKLFIKLPRWFGVPTPIGKYNPDWAVVMDDSDQFGRSKEKMYFVTETKGKIDTDELRNTEKRKIQCAKEHFKSLSVKYVIASTPSDIQN